MINNIRDNAWKYVGGLLYAGVLVWINEAFQLFHKSYLISGWAITLVASTVLLAVFIVVHRVVHQWKEKGRFLLRTYMCGGLEWKLTEDFFQNYQAISGPGNDSVSDVFLEAMVKGPFCPSCKRYIMMVGEDMCECGRKLDFRQNKDVEEFLESLRRRVRSIITEGGLELLQKEKELEQALRRLAFAEAHAAARRGDF